MVLLDNEHFSNVKIEYKEGRYRVTLTDIGYIDNGVVSDILMKGLIGQNGPTWKGNLVSYNGEVTFNKKMRSETPSMVYEILEKFYSDMFTFKKTALKFAKM